MSSKRVILLTKDRCLPSKSNQFYGNNASKAWNNNNNEQLNSINLIKNNESENIKFEQSKSIPFLKKSQNNNGHKNENTAVSSSNVTFASKTLFDFLKQQNKQLMNPEIMQYKTSQKLLNFSRSTTMLSNSSNALQIQRSLASSVGPSVWARLWNNMNRMITKETEKNFVGEDAVGNQYYEYKGGRSDRTNIKRGYQQRDPNASKPAIEWEAWLKGTRRFPPSDEEIHINRLKQQKQLEQDSVTEKRAPIIGSSGKGAGDIDRPKQYPTYDDMEISPGAKKSDNNN